MEIFRLFGSILIDSSEAQKSISKTGEDAEGLGSKLSNGIATAAKWGAAISAAAVAVGGAMVAAAKDTSNALDVIDKGSQRMGITAESYQELAYAAELSGVQMTAMEKAAKKLNGTGVSLEKALNEIASLGSESARTQAAVNMFGESVAYQLTPLLNQGADGLAAMREEANALGLVIDGETVTAGANLNDMFTKVSYSISAVKTAIMSDLLPYVSEILEYIVQNMPIIRDTVTSVIDAVLPIVKTALDVIMQLLPPIMELIKSILDWIMPYLTPILEAISAVVEGLFALISGDTETFIEGLKEFLGALGEAFFGIGHDIIVGLWDGMKSVWEEVKTWIDEKVDAAKNAFKSILEFGAADRPTSVDGYHASGLNTVPYDGYVASLHRGESVMNAGQTQRLMEAIVALGSNQSNNNNSPIELTLNIDGAAFARATYNAMNSEASRRGGSLVTV